MVSLSHNCSWLTEESQTQSKNVLFVENDMRQCKFVVSHFLTAETKAEKKKNAEGKSEL